MGEDTYFWLGASADAETGSREPSRVSPSRPIGFDPARKPLRNLVGYDIKPDYGWLSRIEREGPDFLW